MTQPTFPQSGQPGRRRMGSVLMVMSRMITMQQTVVQRLAKTGQHLDRRQTGDAAGNRAEHRESPPPSWWILRMQTA